MMLLTMSRGLRLAQLVAVVMIPWTTGDCQSPRREPQPRGWSVDTVPLLDISGNLPSGAPKLGDPIAATRLSRGRIVVADRSLPAVLYFDATGGLTRTAGRKGKGPDEFDDLTWLGQCRADSVFVLDGSLHRMTVLDASGKMVRQERFPMEVYQDRIACNRNGRFAAIGNVRGGDHVDVKTWTFAPVRGSVSVSDPGGRFAEVLSDIPVRVPRPLGQTTTMALSSTHLYVGTNDSAVVDRFTLSGARAGRLPVHVSRQRPTARQYDMAIDAHLAFMFPSMAERREHKSRFTRIPPPEFRPLYGEVIADATGTAWVVISALDEPKTRLQVLSDGAGPAAVITLPRSMRLFEIGPDYVLGRYDDEEGEVHLVVYRLTRGAGPTPAARGRAPRE